MPVPALRVHSALILAAVLCGAAGPAWAQSAAQTAPAAEAAALDSQPAQLIAALADGGAVIVFRHAATDFSQEDQDRSDRPDCAKQRNLSADGREQARALGQAIAALHIPIGEVLASPYCRTRETAQLAFGRAEVSLQLKGAAPERERASHRLARLLAVPPPPGRNTVLVTHGFNIQGALDLSVQEAEAVIVAPDGKGGWAVRGRLLAGQWGEAARLVQACRPTEPDALGPYYESGAPRRSSVGEGYVLQGRVLSSADCRPIAAARIEVWLANPQGEYDAAHRATLMADATGAYRFGSEFPGTYPGRPPHIHLKVSAAGYRPLVTQIYPRPGETSSQVDLVLVPERGPGPERGR